jgi:tRNA(adenine34) deaminase
MKQDHNYFMGVALKQAQKSLETGNLPVGSVIVKAGTLIGEGRNVVNSHIDPTAHAEMTAIRNACSNLRTIDLSGCICYTTVEPCPMCCWAILEAGIKQLVIGARFFGLKKVKVGNFSVEKLLAMTGRQLEIIDGIMVKDCTEIRNTWFDQIK